ATSQMTGTSRSDARAASASASDCLRTPANTVCPTPSRRSAASAPMPVDVPVMRKFAIGGRYRPRLGTRSESGSEQTGKGAALDGDGRAGDASGVVAAQERRDGPEVFGTTDLADGDP